MAETHFTVLCPHCKRASKLIPISTPRASPGPLSKVFENTFDSPLQSAAAEESVLHVERRNFWSNPGVTDMIRGVFAGSLVFIYAWYDGSNYAPLWGVSSAILFGVGLPAARGIIAVILHAPRPQKPKEKTQKIKIEVRTQGKGHAHVLLGEMDSKISPDELNRVAKAWSDGTPLSRRKMMKDAKISDTKYRLILSELQRLNLVVTGENHHHELSLSCKALFKQLSSTH